MMLDLERLARQSGKLYRVIAAAADCTEATLNRILQGRVPDLQTGHPRSHRSSALGTRSSWSRSGISRGLHES